MVLWREPDCLWGKDGRSIAASPGRLTSDEPKYNSRLGPGPPLTPGKAPIHGPADTSAQFPDEYRQDLEQAAVARWVEGVPHLPLEPGRWEESPNRHLLGRSQD